MQTRPTRAIRALEGFSRFIVVCFLFLESPNTDSGNGEPDEYENGCAYHSSIGSGGSGRKSVN